MTKSETIGSQTSVKYVTQSEIVSLLCLITVRLRGSNFIRWSFQFQTVLEGNDLFGYFDGSYPSPICVMISDGGSTTSDAYKQWNMTDKSLLSLLMATLDDEAMDIVVGCSSSHEAWLAIREWFCGSSRTDIMRLQTDLLTIKKGNDSIDKYLLRIKHVRDRLRLVGVTMLDEDVVEVTLQGLSHEYDVIKTVIHAKDNPISLKQLRILLLDVERDIKSHFAVCSLNCMTTMAATKGTSLEDKVASNWNEYNIKQFSREKPVMPPGASNGESRAHRQSSCYKNKFYCQICSKTNHVTSDCLRNVICSFCDRKGHVADRCYNNSFSPFYKPWLSGYMRVQDTKNTFSGIWETESANLDRNKNIGSEIIVSDVSGAGNTSSVSNGAFEGSDHTVVGNTIHEILKNDIPRLESSDINKFFGVREQDNAASSVSVDLEAANETSDGSMSFGESSSESLEIQNAKNEACMDIRMRGAYNFGFDNVENAVFSGVCGIGSVGDAIALEDTNQGLGLADQVSSIDQQNAAHSQHGQAIADSIHSLLQSSTNDISKKMIVEDLDQSYDSRCRKVSLNCSLFPPKYKPMISLLRGFSVPSSSHIVPIAAC